MNPASHAEQATHVLILRELYEIKLLLIQHVGSDKYQSIDLQKVIGYIDKSAAAIGQLQPQ